MVQCRWRWTQGCCWSIYSSLAVSSSPGRQSLIEHHRWDMRVWAACGSHKDEEATVLPLERLTVWLRVCHIDRWFPSHVVKVERLVQVLGKVRGNSRSLAGRFRTGFRGGDAPGWVFHNVLTRWKNWEKHSRRKREAGKRRELESRFHRQLGVIKFKSAGDRGQVFTRELSVGFHPEIGTIRNLC